MQDISKGQGRTVLFVSHNMAAVKSLCTRGIVLENGEIKFEGKIFDAIECYLQDKDYNFTHIFKNRQQRKENLNFSFTGIDILNINNDKVLNLLSGEDYVFRIRYQAIKVFYNVGFRLMIYDSDNNVRFLCNNYFSNKGFTIVENEINFADFIIPRFPLPIGEFSLRLTCFSEEGVLDDLEHCFKFNVIGGDFYKTGKEQQAKLGVLIKYDFKNY